MIQRESYVRCSVGVECKLPLKVRDYPLSVFRNMLIDYGPNNAPVFENRLSPGTARLAALLRESLPPVMDFDFIYNRMDRTCLVFKRCSLFYQGSDRVEYNGKQMGPGLTNQGVSSGYCSQCFSAIILQLGGNVFGKIVVADPTVYERSFNDSFPPSFQLNNRNLVKPCYINRILFHALGGSMRLLTFQIARLNYVLHVTLLLLLLECSKQCPLK